MAPRTRSRLRRLLRTCAWLAAVSLALLALAIGLLHTLPGRTLVAGFVESWGSRASGGTLRLGQLELALWRGHAAATAVSLVLPDTRVEAQSVVLDWSPASGPRLTLIRPHVVVTVKGDNAARPRRAEGLAARPWRALERFERAEVVDGRLELRDAKESPWLVLGRVDLEMAGASRRTALRVADAALGWPEGGLRVKAAQAEAALALDGEALVVEQARLTAGAASLELAGRLQRVLPITGTASLRAAFDGALVEALASGSRLEGRIEADASVHVADDVVTGRLDAASRALTVAGLGPWSATGRGRFEGARLVLDAFTARGYGGKLDAQGPLALLASARTDLRVRAEGLDPAALVRAASGAELPLSARAGGTLRWTTEGWDVEASRGEGGVTLQPGAGPGLKPTAAAALRTRGLTLALTGARLEAHGARATGDAEWTRSGEIRGRWSVDVPIAAVGALLADVGHPAQVPEIEGRLLAEADVAGPTASLRVSARVRGQDLALRGRPFGLEAELRYEQGRLSATPLTLRSGTGQATLAGGIPLAAAGEWDLSGEIDTFDLEPAFSFFGLEGSGPATGTVRVTGPRDEATGRTTLRATARLPRPEAGPERVEDAVILELEAASTGRRVSVERLQAEVAGGSLSGTGRYDPTSGALEASLEASGLAWAKLPLVPAAARRIGGTLGGRLSLSGSTTSPAGELELTLAEGVLDGAPLPPLGVAARSDGRQLTMTATGPGPLAQGSARLEGEWPLRLEIDAGALPLQPLLDAFAGASEARATLAASGTIVVELPLRAPSTLRYASSDLAVSGRVRRLEWRTAPFTLRGDRASLELQGLRLTAGKAWLAAQGQVGLAPQSPFDLRVEGHMDLESLDPALPGRTLGGAGELQLQVRGTRESPSLAGELTLLDIRGRFEGARVADLDATARFAGRELQVERLEADVLGGKLRANGSLPLVAGAPVASKPLAFEIENVDLARFMSRERREAADSPSLLLSLDGELRALSASLTGLVAGGRLTRLDTRSLEGTLALSQPAVWSLERGVLELEPVRLAGPLGELEVLLGPASGDAPRGTEAKLTGRVDMRVVSPFLPGTSVSGPARIDARVGYPGGAWRLAGGVKLEGARLSLDTLNFNATALAGELRFEGDRATLEASAASGDGRLHATGSMRLGPSLLGPAQLELTADRVPISYPPGFRGRATGKVNLAGEPGRYRLTGGVDLTQGYYTADFDAKAQSLDRLDWQLGALDGGSLADQVALAVNLRLAEPLRVRNSTMRLDVEGVVTASGTLAQPTARGQVNLREGGELTLGRARVRVANGRIELNGYPATTPVLDFQGASRVSGIALDIRARGTLDDLELTLGSDRTDLSQTDLVTLLLTGRTAAAAASQSGVVVAEQLAMALGGMLQRGVGDTLLIDVSPDRSLLSDDTDPTQRLNIGTRITQNLTVIYSAALDGTEKRFIVEFNPGGGRFRLRAISEEDNSLSFEVTDRFSFDLWNRGTRGAPSAREIERLESLILAGDPKLAAALREAVKLKTHRRYSALQREQAADRVRERLVQDGYRSASVEALLLPADDGVELVVRFEAGPRVAIEWSGDDPGKQAREAAEGAWPAFATPEAAAAQIARAALYRLQAEGYYTARVEPAASSSEGRIEVSLRVTRGPKGRSVAVEFDGNQALDDAALLEVLPKPGSLEFFEALDPRSARIGSDVRLAYAGIGHLRARAGTARTAFDPVAGVLAVTIPVHERAASTVAEIELPPELVAAAEARPQLKLARGEPFDLAGYVADRDAIGEWYRSQGWIDAQLAAVVEARGQSVTVRYHVDAGPRPRIGSVRVVGTGKTSSALIRRSLALREGDVVKPQELALSRERLSDTGIFRSVEVRAEPRAGDDMVRDVLVGLVPKPDVQLEYGVRYTTAGEGGAAGAAPSTPAGGRIQLAGAIELNNPFGAGVKVRSYGSLTTERQTYGVNFDAATILGSRVRTQLFVFDDSDDDIQVSGLASRVRGATLQQSRVLLRDRRSRRWHDRLRLQWGYTFKDIEYLESAENDQFLQGDRAFLALSAIGDERDSLTDPTRGVFWTATTELSRTALGSDVDYVRLYGQLFGYVPLGPLVWAQGLRLGSVPGRDPLLLLENRFRAGGPTTVRGFEQNGLGPQTLEGDSLGGQAIVVLNQELRFPIWRSLKGGVFWDAGNVWLLSDQFRVSDLRQSVGGGLRYMLPFGPIRVEYAWILKRQPGEPQGRFVFGLGHAF
jgi:outer membrane protein assembly complex protein YaeT